MATGILPLCSKATSRGKIPLAIPWFLFSKKKKKHRHSIRRGLVCLMVHLPLFIPHWELCYG